MRRNMVLAVLLFVTCGFVVAETRGPVKVVGSMGESIEVVAYLDGDPLPVEGNYGRQ